MLYIKLFVDGILRSLVLPFSEVGGFYQACIDNAVEYKIYLIYTIAYFSQVCAGIINYYIGYGFIKACFKVRVLKNKKQNPNFTKEDELAELKKAQNAKIANVITIAILAASILSPGSILYMCIVLGLLFVRLIIAAPVVLFVSVFGVLHAIGYSFKLLLLYVLL